MTNDEDEDMTARLLRLAGPRADAPADRAERIRHAVSATWRTELRRRRLRRRLLAGAVVLATAATIVVATRLTVPRRLEAPSKDPAAVVERVQGGTAALSTGRTLPIGEWIETAADWRAALRIDGRASMRLDVSSRARLLDATTIELGAARSTSIPAPTPRPSKCARASASREMSVRSSRSDCTTMR